jgi:hypothetical protein
MFGRVGHVGGRGAFQGQKIPAFPVQVKPTAEILDSDVVKSFCSISADTFR